MTRSTPDRLEAALGQARAAGRRPGAPDRADRRRGRELDDADRRAAGRRREHRRSSGSSRQTRSRRCARSRSTSAWSPSGRPRSQTVRADPRGGDRRDPAGAPADRLRPGEALTKADRARLDALAEVGRDHDRRLAGAAGRSRGAVPAPRRGDAAFADPRAARPPAHRRRPAARPQGARDRRRHPQRIRAHLDARAARDEGRVRRERPRGDRAAAPAPQHRRGAARHHDARDGRLPDGARRSARCRASSTCRSSR